MAGKVCGSTVLQRHIETLLVIRLGLGVFFWRNEGKRGSLADIVTTRLYPAIIYHGNNVLALI